jgi:hypothetical protein
VCGGPGAGRGRREDAALIPQSGGGHDFPSPREAQEFLYQFHDEKKIEEAKRRRTPDEIAYIPQESVELQGLRRVNRSLVQELGSRCAGQRIATVDQDATAVERRKQEALGTYEGERGYQPLLGRRGDYSFGANAAWLRLAVIAHRVLTALKRLALPAELLRARSTIAAVAFSVAFLLAPHASAGIIGVANATNCSGTPPGGTICSNGSGGLDGSGGTPFSLSGIENGGIVLQAVIGTQASPVYEVVNNRKYHHAGVQRIPSNQPVSELPN